MSKKDKLGEAQQKSAERRMEKAEEFADKLVDKLGDKVKCVAVYGSVPKGEHTHESDIDTFVVLDDTKLEKDVPKEAKDKIRKKVTNLANETDDRITIQYFSFLTDFWDSIRKGEPLVIQVLRVGEPVYDVGVFMPAKRMLERGKIKSSDEAVKKRLKLAAAGYKKAEKQVRSSIPHKLEQAVANAGQAPIMLTGRQPPGKEDVGDVLEEMFVENDQLEQKYVDIALEIDEFADKGEKHPEDVTAEELDAMMEKADEFIRRMHKLAGQIGGQKKAQGIVDEYKTFLKANVASLKSQGIEPPEEKDDLPDVVIENTDFGDTHRELFDRWETVMQKVKDKEMSDLDDKEVQELRSETREFVSQVGKDIKAMKEEESGPDVDMPTDTIANQAKQGLGVKDYEKNKKQAEKQVTSDAGKNEQDKQQD
jgi:predicted nucleotidyltransferase